MTTQFTTGQARQAEFFASLHRAGDPLLLANAWDVASEVAIAAAGAKAIATPRAGGAWSLGGPDGAGLGAERAAAVIRRIAAAVSLPVSADIEAGYGDSPDAVAATVAAVVEAGAVGVNLEDRRDGSSSLFEPSEQADRLAAARAAAAILTPVPGAAAVWINARTDVFLSGAHSSTSAGVAAALERAAAYRAAGADSLFVPGLADLAAIADLAAGPLPVAGMAWPGAPAVAALTAAGAARISLASPIAHAAHAVATRAAADLFTTGTYNSSAGGFEYGAMNDTLTL